MENTKHTPTPWTQGRLLSTRQTGSWSPEEKERGDREEKLRIFANFSGLDDGRSRELIATCVRPQDAERIVLCVNKFAAFTNEQVREGIDLVKLVKEKEELVAALSEARDTLVLCTLIDKSNQSDKAVVEADKVLNKYKK